MKREVVLKGVGVTHSVGEVWRVMRGVDLRPRRFVLLHKPDGHPHLWSGETFWDSFELVA